MKTTNALSSTFANGIEVVQDVGNNSENIEAFILTIRGKQVLLDRDLAMLYNVETKVLNQAIKRNQERFPERFRFQLTKEEMTELVTNCDRFSLLKHSSVCPFALTEQGVAFNWHIPKGSRPFFDCRQQNLSYRCFNQGLREENIRIFFNERFGRYGFTKQDRC